MFDKVDLHLHSACSDGLLKPVDLVKMARRHRLKAIALADHDTVHGVTEAITAGFKEGVEVIPGVELGVFYENKELHILGYWPQKIELMNRELLKLRQKRQNRMKTMLELISQLGFTVTAAEMAAEVLEAAPGRMHLARILLRKGYVKSTDEAFQLYIGRGGPAYAARETLTLTEAMALFTATGAFPVLAHPGQNCKPFLSELFNAGIKGIEVFHPDHNAETRRFYLQIANARGLAITGGSDYHGDDSPGNIYPADLSIPAVYLEKLRWTANPD